jgi:hypothetical protein
MSGVGFALAAESRGFIGQIAALTTIERALTNPPKSGRLILSGHAGCGKRRLAAEIATYLDKALAVVDGHTLTSKLILEQLSTECAKANSMLYVFPAARRSVCDVDKLLLEHAMTNQALGPVRVILGYESSTEARGNWWASTLVELKDYTPNQLAEIAFQYARHNQIALTEEQIWSLIRVVAYKWQPGERVLPPMMRRREGSWSPRAVLEALKKLTGMNTSALDEKALTALLRPVEFQTAAILESTDRTFTDFTSLAVSKDLRATREAVMALSGDQFEEWSFLC